jgi:glycosyltransferase involved in cell wall biosynthesis
MNILFLTDNPTLGGTIRILQSWLPLMPGCGLNGHVVTPPGSDFVQWLTANAVPHTANPMPWPSLRWPFPSIYHAGRLALWARQHRIDLIHCNEHNVYPFALLLRRFLPRPLVCHVRYKLEPGYSAWLFGGPARQPDALLWTSRQQQLDSKEAIDGIVSKDRQHTIPLGLDLQSFGTRCDTRDTTRANWGFRPEEIVIGQACALRPRKRLEEFVELVARLASEDERVVGVLAGDARPGDEAYRNRILGLIDQTGLGRRFRWLGNLDDIEPFDQAIDVFVSTSEYETFGNSVCEAMACARPVAAYRGGSVAEVVGDAGLVVETGDLPSLVKAVRQLIRSQELREELGHRAVRRVAERFNPSETLRQLTDVYEKILGQQRPGGTRSPHRRVSSVVR